MAKAAPRKTASTKANGAKAEAKPTIRQARQRAEAAAPPTEPKIAAPVNGPTPEDEAHTLAELIRLDTAAAKLNQERGNILKRFEKKGGDVKAIKAIKTLVTRDAREAEAYLATLTRYGRNAGIKVTWTDGGQAQLADVLGEEAGKPPNRQTEGTRDLAAARAHSDGYNSGLTGAAPSDNPHRGQPGSIEYVEWHDGRDEGQRAREAKQGAGGIGKAPETLADTLEEKPF